MKKEKADILEKVMETETYRVAKEILEKFGNEPSSARPGMVIIFLAMSDFLEEPLTLLFLYSQ